MKDATTNSATSIQGHLGGGGGVVATSQAALACTWNDFQAPHSNFLQLHTCQNNSPSPTQFGCFPSCILAAPDWLMLSTWPVPFISEPHHCYHKTHHLHNHQPCIPVT